MTFNKFYIKLFILIIFISVFGAFTLSTFNNQDLMASRFILAGLWIFSIVLFFKHVRKSTIIIKDFITNVKEGDFVFLPGSKNAFGKEFNDLLNFLNHKIKNIKIEKEEQYHLFTNAVNQTGSGIIVFDHEGKIELINKSAKRLFALNDLKNIQDLKAFNSDLPDKLNSSVDQNSIVSIQVNNELLKIAVYQNQFKLRDRNLKVVSMQNISNELDKEELESWKKLMHVITHEIMNSVTPMKTLAYSLFEIYKKDDLPKSIEEINQQDIDDSFMGLKALNTRAQGLMSFVDSYRKLYKIPKPVFSNFNFQEILDEISILFKNTLLEKNIQLNVSGDGNTILFADKTLITQVFINIMKNAIDALNHCENPKIEIKIQIIDNGTIISISDNGTGISPENLDDIFIPFFTTKKDGSGIGLYYSKMIIYMHKGTLKVSSAPGKGSVFTIQL